VPGNAGETTTNCCGASAAPGSNIDIFKYTGYLTDNLTVTALYGKSRTRHERIPAGYNASLPQISTGATVQVPGVSYPTPQTVTGNLVDPASGDSQRASASTSNTAWATTRCAAASTASTLNRWSASRWRAAIAGLTARRPIQPRHQRRLRNAGAGRRLRRARLLREPRRLFNLAKPTSEQSAQYIQDHWQVTPRVLLDLGLRREQFTNYTSTGDAFISQRNMLAPRLGATWDYAGDGSLKLFANAGRYHLPVPSNLSSNMAAPFTSTSELFTYTGVDPVTGAPTGLHQIGKPYSANNAYGQSRDAREVTAIGLKPLSQDELSLGFEKALNKKWWLA
jgi:outer membrane receptor protein involved in Fe transport